MDIEPGVSMLTDKGDLHGWTHTLTGALCIGAIATLGAPLLIRLVMKRWNSELSHYHVRWLMVSAAPRKVDFTRFCRQFSTPKCQTW